MFKLYFIYYNKRTMSWGTRIKSLALIRPRSNNVLRGRNASLTKIVCRKDSPGCGATNIDRQVIHTVPVVYE